MVWGVFLYYLKPAYFFCLHFSIQAKTFTVKRKTNVEGELRKLKIWGFYQYMQERIIFILQNFRLFQNAIFCPGAIIISIATVTATDAKSELDKVASL